MWIFLIYPNPFVFKPIFLKKAVFMKFSTFLKTIRKQLKTGSYSRKCQTPSVLVLSRLPIVISKLNLDSVVYLHLNRFP